MTNSPQTPSNEENEIEAKIADKRKREGIQYTRGEVDALHVIAQEAGVMLRLEEVVSTG